MALLAGGRPARTAPGAALAAVVEYERGQLRLVDDPGAATSVSVSSTDTAVIFEGAGLRTEESRCATIASGLACERNGFVTLVVSLGDGNDTLRYTAQVTSPTRLDGGLDDDKLSGGPGGEQIAGGPGNDQLHGEDGADRLNGGRGRDTIFGGDGRDRIEPARATTRSRRPTGSGTPSGAARAVTR